MIPYSDPDKFEVIIFLIWCGLWIGLSIIIPFIENKKNK